MSDKTKMLNDTKSFPDSQVVTFEGQKTTLGELRKGSGFVPGAAPMSSGSRVCPRCKSTSTVIVNGTNYCNKCGFDRWL